MVHSSCPVNADDYEVRGWQVTESIVNNAKSNPFKPPASTATVSSETTARRIPVGQISNGILAGVIAWAPGSVVSWIATAIIVRWYNPDAIFYGGLVVLFWMCVAGTVVALLTGYLLFFPAVVWSYRRGISPLPINMALALLLTWIMPTVVLRAMSGEWHSAQYFTPWCVAPALVCCLVFHVHQRRAMRLARDIRPD